jgi:hypothetical protein
MWSKGLIGLFAATALAIVLCWGGGETPVSCGDAILASRAAVTAVEQSNALVALADQGERPECVDHLPALGLEAPAAMRRWPGDASVQAWACTAVRTLSANGTREVRMVMRAPWSCFSRRGHSQRRCARPGRRL